MTIESEAFPCSGLTESDFGDIHNSKLCSIKVETVQKVPTNALFLMERTIPHEIQWSLPYVAPQTTR